MNNSVELPEISKRSGIRKVAGYYRERSAQRLARTGTTDDLPARAIKAKRCGEANETASSYENSARIRHGGDSYSNVDSTRRREVSKMKA